MRYIRRLLLLKRDYKLQLLLMRLFLLFVDAADPQYGRDRPPVRGELQILFR